MFRLDNGMEDRRVKVRIADLKLFHLSVGMLGLFTK